MLSIVYAWQMNKRSYIALPTKLGPEVEAIAASLGLNVNSFGVRCMEGCVAAIKSATPTQVPIVHHARRILHKETNAADRLLVNLLEKTFPDLPKNTERFREILIEETNRIDGELTTERLKATHSLALDRWKAEERFRGDPVGEMVKIEQRRKAAKSK
jgi:hypothetical protein